MKKRTAAFALAASSWSALYFSVARLNPSWYAKQIAISVPSSQIRRSGRWRSVAPVMKTCSMRRWGISITSKLDTCSLGSIPAVGMNACWTEARSASSKTLGDEGWKGEYGSDPKFDWGDLGESMNHEKQKRIWTCTRREWEWGWSNRRESGWGHRHSECHPQNGAKDKSNPKEKLKSWSKRKPTPWNQQKKERPRYQSVAAFPFLVSLKKKKKKNAGNGSMEDLPLKAYLNRCIKPTNSLLLLAVETVVCMALVTVVSPCALPK